jgi:hypothetical protein
MDREELKAKHPELYKAIYEEGRTAERGRVSAHLTLAASSGAMDTAVKAIQDGSGVTDQVVADHTAAKLNGLQIQARTADEPKLGAPATPDAAEADEAKVIAIAMGGGLDAMDLDLDGTEV